MAILTIVATLVGISIALIAFLMVWDIKSNTGRLLELMSRWMDLEYPVRFPQKVRCPACNKKVYLGDVSARMTQVRCVHCSIIFDYNMQVVEPRT